MDTLSEPRRSDTFHPFAPTSYKNKAEFCNVLIPVLIQHFDLKPESTNVIYNLCVCKGVAPSRCPVVLPPPAPRHPPPTHPPVAMLRTPPPSHSCAPAPPPSPICPHPHPFSPASAPPPATSRQHVFEPPPPPLADGPSLHRLQCLVFC
jgi:hypothetical protein